MYMQHLTEEQIDNTSIDRFAEAMKRKMAVKRDEGRGGWHDKKQCTSTRLIGLFVDHLTKTNEGNLVDIANLCMMIHERGIHTKRIELEVKKRTVSLFDLFDYAKRQ